LAFVKINPERPIGTVDRRILSGFTEHLGRCIYSGIFDEGSPLADERGFRKDVVEAVRALRPPVLRWPGGNFASGYHWTDGIGPADSRPRRMELAWRGVEPNRFGTDEFMAFCEAVGAEPYLCLNMGTGTIDEAQAWLEYCNGTTDTEWVRRRRDNGHPGPYKVKYWGLGNEMYGDWQIGQLSAEDYVKEARQLAKVLKLTDPGIELVSCGESGLSDWDATVIDGLAPYVQWHSIHIYTGDDDYWTNVLAPHQTERALRVARSLIEKARYKHQVRHPIHVAYDEWNVWFRDMDGTAGLEEQYNLGDALAVATYLHAFIRHADTVKMANLAQLVNVIAPIVTSPEGLFLQSIYHPLRLFADHLGETALDIAVECDVHDFIPAAKAGPWPNRFADLGPFPVLDAVATRSEAEGKLMLSVINRSPDTDVTAQVSLGDSVRGSRVLVQELNAAGWDTTNSFERPGAVSVAETAMDNPGGGWQHRFPAHSLTVFTVQAETVRG
jgi:alpha-L-arabinofuranosidase